MKGISVLKGDITNLKVDAVVNAANSSLKGGGGVDGAIHRVGGLEILKECNEWTNKHGKLSTGQAMITTAGKLPTKHVIHTVGPVWNGGNNEEEQLLANAYKHSLELASEKGLSSVAFPNISTGVYGFPKKKAAEIAVKTVKEFLETQHTVNEVTFVCFDEENYQLYQGLVK